jgi:outer membrane protein assembly factor BamB
MTVSRLCITLLVLPTLLMLIVTPGYGQEAEPGKVPPEIEQFASDWILPNKDYANTRFTTDAAIDSTNVHLLRLAWTFELPGVSAWGAAASNPIIAGDVVYIQDLRSNVFALDFATGTSIWERIYDNEVTGPNGVGIGHGSVFLASGVDEFSALSMETGEEVWTRLTNQRPTGAIQPVAFDNFVFITSQAGVAGSGEVDYAGYQGGTSGHMYALDHSTGEIVWEFQVVEDGFWGNPEVNSGGGTWYPPAIDTERGMIFWGTGNPAPFPGTIEFPNASSRPGENLYTNALVSFDYASGEMLWYYLAKPYDLFDLDFQISPVLGTATVDGEERDIVIGAGKLGRVVALERETGEVVWDTPVGIHQNDELREVPPGEVVEVYPGILGGVETPMALADGIVFVPVLNLPTPYTATGWDAQTGTDAVQQAESRTEIQRGRGELNAIDINTGEIVWKQEFDAPVFGGATVVNDLVFTSTFDGVIYAFMREDGREVWRYRTEGGINAWPAVAGDSLIVPVGLASPPFVLMLRLTEG